MDTIAKTMGAPRKPDAPHCKIATIVNDEIYAQVKAAAAAQGRSVCAELRFALGRYYAAMVGGKVD